MASQNKSENKSGQNKGRGQMTVEEAGRKGGEHSHGGGGKSSSR